MLWGWGAGASGTGELGGGQMLTGRPSHTPEPGQGQQRSITPQTRRKASSPRSASTVEPLPPEEWWSLGLGFYF